MPEPLEEALQKLITDIKDTDDAAEASTRVKNLKTFAEAKNLLKPEPEPTPEPSGPKAFLERHADSLIKMAGTVVVVIVIAVVETKGDVIFRSKATKFI